jgi:lipopolysaccharide exporter
MNKNYWLHSGFYTLLDRFMQMVFGFGGLFFLLRIFSKDDFGTWVIFLTIVSFIEVGRIGLLSNALVKYLNTSGDENYPVIVSASFALNLILTAIFMVLLLVLAQPAALLFEAPSLAALLRIYAITTFLLTPHFQLTFLQQANMDFKGVFWSNIVKQGILFGFIVITYLSQMPINLESLAKVQVFAALPAGITAFVIARKFVRIDRKLDLKWMKTLFAFGKFVLGTNLATMAYKSVDKMLLGILLNPIAVASYELAVRISNLAEVPTFSMATILFPKSVQLADTEGFGTVKHLYEKSVGAILAIVLPFILAVWILAGWIIGFLGKGVYEDSTVLLRLTLLYGLFVPFSVQFGTVLDAIGKPRLNFHFTLLSAIVNLISNFIFISLLGVMGAAYGTLVSFIIMFVLMQLMLHRTIKTNPFNAIPHMLNFYKEILSYVDRSFISGRAGLRGR